MTDPVTLPEIAHAIRAAGLSNKVLALHSSIKSFGHLEGGPDTLIHAFMEAGCTLLVPAFTYACHVAPQRGIYLNGIDPAFVPDASRMVVEFDPECTLASPEMGSLPARILQTAGRARGQHPLNSLTALGPHAKAIITEQGPLNVYGPYKWVYDRPPAFLVLLGVDLTKATPIHFAEQRAGRRLFRRWGREAGRIVESETGGCSEGFNRLLPCVETIEHKLFVGPSLWRIYPFRDFIDRVSAVIRTDPSITHCDDAACVRCRDAGLGGPIL